MVYLICVLYLQDSDDEIEMRLTVYPTIVVTGDEIFLYFERAKICQCRNELEAAAAITMAYYVFDVQYPQELLNTLNFVDVYICHIDKKAKIRARVQRKVNVLLAV